jgi:hypothetical protein
MFSDWGKVPQDTVGGAVLTLTLTAFEDKVFFDLFVVAFPLVYFGEASPGL